MSWKALPLDIRVELQHRLTPRQFDVYVLRLAGCSYAFIAQTLNISIRTVRDHETRARQKHAQLKEHAA